MIKLVIALVVSFLVVVFYFFGVMWGLIVSAILLVAAPYISFTILKIMKNKTGGTPGTKKPGWIIWPIIVLAAIAITWGITASQCKKAEEDRLTEIRSKIKMVHPNEEWIFTWTLPPGQTTNGRNRHTLEVEITRNDENSLWAILHDKGNGEDVKVGGLRLAKNGDNLIGTWNNYLDGDGGKCYLYKEGTSHWSGHYELKDESHTDCTLKLK